MLSNKSIVRILFFVIVLIGIIGYSIWFFNITPQEILPILKLQSFPFLAKKTQVYTYNYTINGQTVTIDFYFDLPSRVSRVHHSSALQQFLDEGDFDLSLLKPEITTLDQIPKAIEINISDTPQQSERIALGPNREMLASYVFSYEESSDILTIDIFISPLEWNKSYPELLQPVPKEVIIEQRILAGLGQFDLNYYDSTDAGERMSSYFSAHELDRLL